MDKSQSIRPLAIVTGASSGIGFELARCCAPTHDLIIAADRGSLQARASQLRSMGAQVTDLLVDGPRVQSRREFEGTPRVHPLLRETGRWVCNKELE